MLKVLEKQYKKETVIVNHDHSNVTGNFTIISK